MGDLSPILAAVQAVLSEMPGRSGHIDEIADRAIQRNSALGLTKEVFAAKAGQALAAHVKRKGSAFGKVPGKRDDNGKAVSFRRGCYRLRQVREPDPILRNIPPSVETGYLGKAGEHAVMSELLFWGFNASLMAVDQGIDVVASRGGHYFHLQVKTATARADGKYWFSIRNQAFESNHRSSTFYVLVLRARSSHVFLVFPSSWLDIQRNAGMIRDGESALSFTITLDKRGKNYLLNSKSNISQFVNNFGQIA